MSENITDNKIRIVADLTLKDKGLKCRYCGRTESIKYKSKILIDGEVHEVYVCNKCTLSSIIGVKGND